LKPLVSVIVPTKNNIGTIERCLISITQQSYTKIELIVVDHHSTDGTINVAKKYTRKVYSKGPERSAQRNFGASKAKGSFLLFIDSDMELTKDVVKDCVKNMGNYIGLVVPEVFVGEGFWTRCKILEKSSYAGTDDGMSARFYRKKDFFKVGRYDESLSGPEDIDLHKRMMNLGAIGNIHEHIIHHDGRLTLYSIVKKRHYYSLSLERYKEKHPEAYSQEARFIRPAYIKNWQLFADDPVHAVGFLFMRLCEGLAVLYALHKH
jgi:glycosyltransferase involved in cell wall biosynthesis